MLQYNDFRGIEGVHLTLKIRFKVVWLYSNISRTKKTSSFFLPKSIQDIVSIELHLIVLILVTAFYEGVFGSTCVFHFQPPLIAVS